MRNYLDILKQLAETRNENLNILEIGCIRSIDKGYDVGDGHSTYHIAKWIKEGDLKHKFTSIDINTKVCSDYLHEKELSKHVKLLQIDSVKFLKNTKEKFDFIYLDSENDAEKILQQFKLCQKVCRHAGIIIVDDCDFGSAVKVKGNLLIPYLQKNKIKHEIAGIQVTVFNGLIHDYSYEVHGWYDFKDIYQNIVNRFPDGHFVEVGSWLGKSAISMATMIQNSGNNITFDCVDSWEPQKAENGYPEIENPYQTFLENIQYVKEYINVIRKPSVDAAKQYHDNSLDFVFIDASHTYNDVCDDIEAWYPKVKRGGVIAGHDWLWPDVAKAVSEKLTGIYVSNNSWAVYKPKVYDCFLYFNESDLLEIRLNELNNVVDTFVIVEATETHSGNKKPLNFNKELLKRYNIEYVVVDLPEGISWERETFQRNAILRGITGANDKDYVIISDVDEIPKASVIQSFRGDSARLLMNQYRWKYNNFETGGWSMPIITRKETVVKETPQKMRVDYWCDTIENAGWHFTGIADVEGIILKFNSFSHTEMQTVANREYIEKILKENNSNGARDITLTPVKLDSTFPQYLTNNKSKFKKFII